MWNQENDFVMNAVKRSEFNSVFSCRKNCRTSLRLRSRKLYVRHCPLVSTWLLTAYTHITLRRRWLDLLFLFRQIYFSSDDRCAEIKRFDVLTTSVPGVGTLCAIWSQIVSVHLRAAQRNGTRSLRLSGPNGWRWTKTVYATTADH